MSLRRKEYREVAVFKDFIGNEIRVGDFIVYGASAGDCPEAHIGKVRYLREGRDVETWGNQNWSLQIGILGWVKDGWRANSNHLRNDGKTICLQKTSHVLKIEPSAEFRLANGVFING